MHVLRTKLRPLVPAGIRRFWSSWRRRRADRAQPPRFAATGPRPDVFHVIAGLRQPILVTSGSQAKVRNILLAIEGLRPILVRPGETLSFWRVVGAPTARRGYQRGRNIVNGRLATDYGGGLCQLAGLLYHLSLLGGLTIVERHAHSLDIYAESERYGPLGADATVVFGYKDLRVRNDGPYPIWFTCSISAQRLEASIRCTQCYPVSRLHFERVEDTATHARVRTWRDGRLEAESSYRRVAIVGA